MMDQLTLDPNYEWRGRDFESPAGFEDREALICLLSEFEQARS
jgi:hypothetical protein